MSDSARFAPVDCPLCLHQDLWKGARECPGCHRLPEEILADPKPAKISRFKLPGLYVLFPELARVDTEREMKAVKE